MSDTVTRRLQFGYNRNIPADVTAAWGARWIIREDDGSVDQLYDRQDAFGTPEEKAVIIDTLNGGVGAVARKMCSTLLTDGTMRTSSDDEFVLYDDGKFVVKGSPQRSNGYFYVAAYFIPAEVPDAG
jgi:hypothetical protein